MTPLSRLQSTKADLDAQWRALQEQMHGVQMALALARIEDEARLRQDLARLRANQEELGTQIEAVEDKLRLLQQQELVREAIRLEGNQSYALSISKWREVEALGPSRHEPDREIQRLGDLLARANKRQRVLAQLAVHREAQALLEEVARALHDPAGPPLALEELLDQLLDKRLSPDAFVGAWRQLQKTIAPDPTQLDYRALYQRLSRGEIALFLGADLLRCFDETLPDRHHLARQLADGLKLPPATLSAVAEYFHMSLEHGEGSLLRALHPLLPRPKDPNPLYALLSQIGEPLLILHTGHDTLLESCFARSEKPFAVVSTVITPSAELRLGQVLVSYSDREQPDPPRMSEELSHLSLLEKGYSVIFKLCGTCPEPGAMDDRLRCGFVLSESSHFAFARLIDRVLPSYLGKQLGPRGLWFLGFAPEQWEDRLFASAILESRRSLEPPNVLRPDVRAFEEAYWQSRGVRRHNLSLPRFVTLLQGAAQ